MDKRFLPIGSLLALVLVFAGCGESRFQECVICPPGGPGGPGGGVGGPRFTCDTDSTGKVHINKMDPTSQVLVDQVVITSPQDVVCVQLFVFQVPDWKAQVFTVTLERNGEKFELKPEGAANGIVQDTLGTRPLPSIELRNVGCVTGLPPGTYVMRANHAFMDPRFSPPADLDEGWQYVDTFPGTITICRPTG